jgi:hypothetical protein
MSDVGFSGLILIEAGQINIPPKNVILVAGVAV